MKRFLAALSLLLFSPAVVTACDVCFGNPEDPQTKGMAAAIITMLIVVYATLLTIIGFFVYRYFRRRAELAAVQS
ncbi:MAG: hypothetical protein QNK37_38200 [Acidobacteriota bacterium]|nr:hypothetical protein [Acidobacteriota bacterium]